MRNFFKEDDIISGEIQGIGSHDGKISMQTRNLKYGKQVNGFMFKVDHNYIRRMKNHILEFFSDESQPVGCIVGTNGYVWIYAPEKQDEISETPAVKPVSKETRLQMSILRNAIVILE